MQPDLSWNVAGIPPEAKEAARAAARREGLSVSEWMTRRILRSFADVSQKDETSTESWRDSGPDVYRPVLAEPPTQRDSEEMLAHVSRTESEAQNVYRRLEDQLRNVGRRLDATEHSQSENNRAMSKAAAEINIAAREQAQAFDQLGAHVVALNERLSRIEHETTNDGLKAAVKALHQGLSRLADQVSQTAHQSASQIAVLAENVEHVADKMVEARSDAELSSHTLEDRIAILDERAQRAERAAQTSVLTAEKAFEAVEATQEAGKAADAELQRQSSTLTQLSESLGLLASRLASSEALHAGTMARLEESVDKLESRGNETAMDHCLQGIEHALTDIVGRLEKIERSNADTAGNVEETLRSLALRVDAVDRRHREAVAELRAAVKEASGSLEAIDPTPPPPPPPAPAVNTALMLDLPPFPTSAAPQTNLQQPFSSDFAAAPLSEPPPFPPDQSLGGHAFGTDTFASNTAQQADAVGTESFLAAARRSARAASAADVEQAVGGGAFGGFSWGTSQKPETESQSWTARYALIGLLALLIVGAVAAGVFLSHGLNLTAGTTGALPPSIQSQRIASVATQPAPASNSANNTTSGEVATITETPANEVPGSPVIAPVRHSRTSTTSVQVRMAPPVTQPRPVAETPASSSASPSQASVSVQDRLAALANSGNAKAELLLGLKYLDGDGVAVSEAEAAKWLERAANQNEAIAAYRLGTLYERGHGVPADAAKATQWYETAAKAGNRKAMHNLAVAYAEGNGVQKNLVVAAQWFTRAANFGLADSEFNLAVLYERGMGVQQSLLDAYKWYAIAAAQGDAESKARIDALSTQLSADDKGAAQKAADNFRPQPLDRNANTPPDATGVIGG